MCHTKIKVVPSVKTVATFACIAWGKDFYTLSRWRNVMERALELYGKIGCKCGNSNVDKPAEVDHIKPRSRYPDLVFSMTNLQVLCEKGNSSKGNRHSSDYRTPNQKRLAEIYAANPLMC